MKNIISPAFLQDFFKNDFWTLQFLFTWLGQINIDSRLSSWQECRSDHTAQLVFHAHDHTWHRTLTKIKMGDQIIEAHAMIGVFSK